jgi:TRAP-type C4-dicarboxylate transport system substrate-binding protein
LGGTPISNILPEVYESLRTGVLDGYIGSYESVYAWSFYEVVKYCTAYPLLNGTHGMFMNPDIFDSLPDDLQKILENVIKDTLDNKIATFFDDEGVYGMGFCQEKGLEFYDLEPGTLEEMLSKTSHFIDDYAQELSSKGYDGEAMVAKYRELVEKYNELYPYRYSEFIKVQ